MRTESIDVKFVMSFPVDKEDKNGVIYTKDAVFKAFDKSLKISQLLIGETILIAMFHADVTGFCHNGFEISDEKDDGEEDDDSLDDYDYCYECGGYGDDYYFDDGEMQCRCQECPFNPDRPDDCDA